MEAKAKEKAKELFNEFYMVLFDSDSDKGEEVLVSLLSKKCALKCCDEMINDRFDNRQIASIENNKSIKFLIEVKQEIEKL